MKKNVSGQTIGAQMVSATDGSAFTGSVTVAVTGNGGTQATGSVGSGACTHEGNGYHSYAPAQAETNYDHVAFTFTGTGAVPATVQVYTSFPQTGDSFARIGAAGASLTEAGGTGDHLTALPWNAAWDAEVQSEAADALTAYDPPTKAELDSAVSPLATAASLATSDGKLDDIKAKTDDLTFTVAGSVDSNIRAVNEVAVDGAGSEADPWGPAA